MNTSWFTLSLSLLLCISCAVSQDEDSARLLVSKHVLNQMLVEGKDVTVEYKLFNVGESAALNVELEDSSFPLTDFEVVVGSLKAKWSRIGANKNVTHVTILRPLKPGYFNFTAAQVSYSAEGSASRQVGHSSAPGEGGIISLREYDRRFSPHITDWAVFAVLTLPSLGMPFALWFNSKRKYESTIKTKKN